MSNQDISKTYVKYDHITHVKNRPGMYIGSIDEDSVDTWIYNNELKKMEKKKLNYNPGLFKIFDEILVNASDHETRLKSKNNENKILLKNIKVKIDNDTGIIEVYNDGDGIDVIEHPTEKVYIPEMIFGHMLSSTNYDDSEERVVGGQNGIGAKACNIFSKWFEVETIDNERKLKYIQKFENNMTVINKPKVTKYSKKPYTIIRFLPDYQSFKTNGLSEDMYKIMEKRVYDMCAVTSKDVNIYFNEQKIEYKTFEKYVDLYIGSKTEHVRVHEEINDRWEIVASYNEYNGFEQISFVNGIWTIKGGKHVEYILNQIIKKLTELITKKNKDLVIKPQSIKENLILFVKSTIVNPMFDSQSKETLTTPSSKFGSKAELSDKFVDKLYKSGIVEKIIEMSQTQTQKDLKKTDGKKKKTIKGIAKLDDANWAGTDKSKECTLILTEGDSAKTMAIAGLSKVGRDKYGVFPLKGKLMNVKETNVKKILENEEISNLKKILGLESGKNYQNLDDLRYGKIMIMTDQDTDGSHIKGLIFNLFHTLWPTLLKKFNFLSSMMTPIVKASKNKNIVSFYNLTDFENWKKVNNLNGWTIKYYKGLGTSTEEEAVEYFQKLKTIDYEYNGELSENSIDLAFNKKRADDRKKWLSTYNRQEVININDKNISYDEFIHKELKHFSNYDLERSIPNIMDGFKTSLRKIFYSCLKKNIYDKEIKVAQLAGYVSENASYHHGEASLQSAIVGLAQDFVGSNNINLLLPKGQFGSRVQGGKDTSQPRYIFTLLNNICESIFVKEDAKILTYKNDDGEFIEPEYYLPIIPMILVNGAVGIGTGFSTNIPCFNPKDIVEILKKLIKNEDCTTQENIEIIPWYSGFEGTIYKNGNKYVSKGIYKRISPVKIQVTELPIGYWTEDFKTMLEEMLDEKDTPLKSYESNYTHLKVDFTLTFTNSDILDNLLKPITIKEKKATDDYSTRENETNQDSESINVINISSRIQEEPSVVLWTGLSPNYIGNEFENKFKMTSSKVLSTSNMYLFNSKCQIEKFNTPFDVIKCFYNERLPLFETRKQKLLEELKSDIMMKENKIRFIKETINRTIIVSEMTKEELEKTLEEKKYNKIETNDSKHVYNYLIDIPIYKMTKDEVKHFDEEIQKLKSLYDKIEQKTIQDMWLENLETFENKYDKYFEIRLSKYQNTQTKSVKKNTKKV
jgi:DNA topoisomerase-2